MLSPPFLFADKKSIEPKGAANSRHYCPLPHPLTNPLSSTMWSDSAESWMLWMLLTPTSCRVSSAFSARSPPVQQVYTLFKGAQRPESLLLARYEMDGRYTSDSQGLTGNGLPCSWE